MKNDPLLQPLTIRHVTFRNRVMSTSHACGLEEDGGMPGETYQAYHVEKARGGLGLTMFGGSAYVDRDSTWATGQLNMSTDRIIPYLERFSGRVHDEGAGIMIQLTHLGRRGETNAQNWLPTIGPSVVRETGHRSFPREMDEYDIRRVVRAFGDAAYRAKQGGLDGMETMVGGHLIGQFLSPVTNKRTDHYGGSAENRCRFGLLVHEEIRRRVGDEFLVGMRFPIDEAVKGGMNFDECVEIARMFERSGLVDFFNANYGRLDTELALLTDCMPGMASPIAPWLRVAGAFKQSVNLPVFHAARITDLATARHAIREGLLDMVAMTRAHIADPHIVNKIVAGEEQRIRPCVGMTHCMGTNRPTCIHNPATARENHWPHVIAATRGSRRRLVVVGAGPAGLECGRILGERGHEVTLLEASIKPGGQLLLAGRASWRKDTNGIIDWRTSELDRLGVEIRTNYYATAEDVLALEPDGVIMATGGIPDLDWLTGSELVSSVWDVLGGTISVGSNPVIYDGTGRHPALTVADYCVTSGNSRSGTAISGQLPRLVLLDDTPAAELDYGERVIWKRELALAGIEPERNYRLQGVDGEEGMLVAHFVHELSGAKMNLQCDQVIVEHGTVPVSDLFDELRPSSNNDGVTDIDALLEGKPQPGLMQKGGFELHRVGDALSSRNLAAAFYDALRLCSVM